MKNSSSMLKQFYEKLIYDEVSVCNKNISEYLKDFNLPKRSREQSKLCECELT